MTYMEFLESLVNAQTEDERMSLVKEHAETFNQDTGGADLQATLDEMTAALEASNQTVTQLKQEIKDRFFGKFKEEKETESSDAESEPEEEEKEPTLNDLGFGKKQY